MSADKDYPSRPGQKPTSQPGGSGGGYGARPPEKPPSYTDLPAPPPYVPPVYKPSDYRQPPTDNAPTPGYPTQPQPTPEYPSRPTPEYPTPGVHASRPTPEYPRPTPQYPTQPTPQYPTQPTPQYPTQPTPEYPSRPTPEYPTPGDYASRPTPQYPTQPTPQYPTQPTPEYPRPTPQYPTQPTPQYPTQPTPQYPTQPTPQYPTQYPTQPTPDYPTQQAPQYPTQPTPDYPTQQYPTQPTPQYPAPPTPQYPTPQPTPQYPTQAQPTPDPSRPKPEYSAQPAADPCDAPVDPTNPATQLKALQECLEKAQADEKKLEGQVQRYGAQAKALSGLLDELEKTKADYHKEQRRLDEKQKGFQSFYDSEIERLKDELGASAGQIGTTVEPFLEIIRTLKDEIPKQEKKIAEWELKLVELQKEEAKKKATFELWKKPVASIDARHGKLTSLAGKIIEACKNGELAFGYWLLTTIETPKDDEDRFALKLNGPPQVVPTADLQSKIIEAWNCYAKVIKSTQDMDAQIKSGKDILATKKAQLDDAKAKFDARVQAALSAIKPK